MNGNRIPRTAKKLKVTMKRGTIAGSTGEILNAYKDTNGWHGTNSAGKSFYLFLSMLRNPDVCSIEILG